MKQTIELSFSKYINIHGDPDWNTNDNAGDNTWYHTGGCGADGISWVSDSCSNVYQLPSSAGATLQFGDDDNQKTNLLLLTRLYQ